MGSLEKRYAEALLALTDNVNQADYLGLALGTVGRLFRQNREFRSFILNPFISKENRSESLYGVLELLGYLKNKSTNIDNKPDSTNKRKNAEESETAYDVAGGELMTADAGVLLLRFLQLLLEKGRLAFLPNISEEYNKIKAKHRKVIQITVRSSSPLDSDELDTICGKYKFKYGAASSEIQNIIEPSLLGDVSIQIGDMPVDDTLYGRLATLARTITAGAEKQSAEAG